jgi:molybdopterin converting factor small subunit
MRPEAQEMTREQTQTDVGTIELICFGQLAEALGWTARQLPCPDHTDALRMQLLESFPQLASMRFTVAVNRNIAHTNVPLKPGDQVALMPPFSGG